MTKNNYRREGGLRCLLNGLGPLNKTTGLTNPTTLSLSLLERSHCLFLPSFLSPNPQEGDEEKKKKKITEMLELLILGCAGVVVFLHSANLFFRAISKRAVTRSLRSATTAAPLPPLVTIFFSCCSSRWFLSADDDFCSYARWFLASASWDSSDEGRAWMCGIPNLH